MPPQPLPNNDNLRQRVLAKLVTAPTVLIPMLGGATTLLGTWATGIGGTTGTVIGAAGLLIGGGVLATRWLLGFDKAVEKVLEEDERSRRKKRKRALNALDRELRRDGDPRSQAYLRKLREIYNAFQADFGGMDVSTSQLVDIVQRSSRLFDSCIDALKRSLALARTARKLNTIDAKREVLTEREIMMDEIRQSVEQLARISDSVHRMAITREGDRSLSTIRKELEQSLDVARRVEDRMRTIESTGPIESVFQIEQKDDVESPAKPREYWR